MPLTPNPSDSHRTCTLINTEGRLSLHGSIAERPSALVARCGAYLGRKPCQREVARPGLNGTVLPCRAGVRSRGGLGSERAAGLGESVRQWGTGTTQPVRTALLRYEIQADCHSRRPTAVGRWLWGGAAPRATTHWHNTGVAAVRSRLTFIPNLLENMEMISSGSPMLSENVSTPLSNTRYTTVGISRTRAAQVRYCVMKRPRSALTLSGNWCFVQQYTHTRDSAEHAAQPVEIGTQLPPVAMASLSARSSAQRARTRVWRRVRAAPRTGRPGAGWKCVARTPDGAEVRG